MYATWDDVIHANNSNLQHMDRCNTSISPFFRVIYVRLYAVMMAHISPQNTLLQGKWIRVDCVYLRLKLYCCHRKQGNEEKCIQIGNHREYVYRFVLTEFINGTANANGSQAIYTFLVNQSHCLHRTTNPTIQDNNRDHSTFLQAVGQ